jgi:hypothetical protein
MLGSSGPNGDPTDAIIVQDLAAVGVKAELTMATSAEFNTDYYSGQYQLSWNGTTYAPAWIDYGFLTSKSSADSSPVSDPVLQRLWQRGIRVPTKLGNRTVWRQLMTRIVTQAYAIPLCNRTDWLLVSPKVGGVGPQAAGALWNTLRDWYPTGKK